MIHTKISFYSEGVVVLLSFCSCTNTQMVSLLLPRLLMWEVIRMHWLILIRMHCLQYACIACFPSHFQDNGVMTQKMYQLLTGDCNASIVKWIQKGPSDYLSRACENLSTDPVEAVPASCQLCLGVHWSRPIAKLSKHVLEGIRFFRVCLLPFI